MGALQTDRLDLAGAITSSVADCLHRSPQPALLGLMVDVGLRIGRPNDADARRVVLAASLAAATRGETGLAPSMAPGCLDAANDRVAGCREIHHRRPDLSILIMSMYDREQYFFEAVSSGAAGPVLKRHADRDIVAACSAVLRGESFIYPAALTSLMRTYRERLARGERTGRGPLTPREADVAKLIAEGQTAQQIAACLTISPKTVERHRANILEKLNLRDRVDLTR